SSVDSTRGSTKQAEPAGAAEGASPRGRAGGQTRSAGSGRTARVAEAAPGVSGFLTFPGATATVFVTPVSSGRRPATIEGPPQLQSVLDLAQQVDSFAPTWMLALG